MRTRRTVLAGAFLSLLLPGMSSARAGWKQRDLEGVWTTRSLTTLQRRAEFKSLVITEKEAAAFEQRTAALRERADREVVDTESAPPSTEDIGGGFGTEWLERSDRLGRIRGEVRTSWITEPADGQIPYTASALREIEQALRAQEDFSGPEVRNYEERCLINTNASPPTLSSPYGSYVQIVLTAQHVVILHEMNHDSRIVPLGERKHMPPQMRPWLGDSVGWWEGDTLVVRTVNFHPGERLRWKGSYSLLYTPQTEVLERYTRIGANEILYAFEVSDPFAYSQAWRAEVLMTRAPTQILEFACHEGNYGLPNILAGAREEERSGMAAVQRQPEVRTIHALQSHSALRGTVLTGTLPTGRPCSVGPLCAGRRTSASRR